MPVNPTRFRRGVSMQTGMIVTAAAGPFSNLILAVLSGLALGLVARFAPGTLEEGSSGLGLASLLTWLIIINVTLALFNMIPIPPLDGGRVLTGLLPLPLARRFARIEPFGFAILLLLLVFHKVGAIVEQPVVMILRMLKVPF